jgi:hypothetical protein
MGYSPQFIGPFQSGLVKYFKPFLIGEDAFETLEDCYSYRGTINKRNGSTLLGTLTSDVNEFTAITFGGPTQFRTKFPHALQNNNVVFIDGITTANPGMAAINQTWNVVTVIDIFNFSIPAVSTGAGTGGAFYLPVQELTEFLLPGTFNESLLAFTPNSPYIYNTATSAFDYNGFLQAPPVITNVAPGATTDITTAANHLLTIGDYIYIDGVLGTIGTPLNGNVFQVTATPAPAATTITIAANTVGLIYGGAGRIRRFFNWTGINSDFFKSTNYQNALWTTNYRDPISMYNGNTTAGWIHVYPHLAGAAPAPEIYLQGCLLLIPYKGHLVALNTIEGQLAGALTTHRQRALWCQLGTSFPTTPATMVATYPAVTPPATGSNPTDADSWRYDIPGRGGYIDADTSEEIVSCEIIHDVLIVFFERSTWRLRYTGDPILPFLWERISVEFGSEAPRGTVVIDNNAYAFSRRGFVAADTNQVQRIDMQIPDQSFSVEAGAQGASLNYTCVSRDFRRQFIYWAFVPLNYEFDTNEPTSPQQILAYNWLDKSYSIFNQPIRCMSRYIITKDRTWATTPEAWEDLTDLTWEDSSQQSQYPYTVGGNVYGNVLQILDDTAGGYDYNDLKPTKPAYYGFDVQTKHFNPYLQQGKRCRLEYVDIYANNTNAGRFTIEVYINDAHKTLTDSSAAPVYSKEVSTEQDSGDKYTRIFLGVIARNIQLRLFMTSAQIYGTVSKGTPPVAVPIGNQPFQMQGMTIWTKPVGVIKDL